MDVQRSLTAAQLTRLRRGLARATVLTHQGWFVGPRRHGTLADFATRYLSKTTPLRALTPGPLAETISSIEQAGTLSFVVLQLIPYLRTLTDALGSSSPPHPEPPAELMQELVSRATRLRARFDERARAGGATEELCAWLGTPCAIVERLVVPLEPVARVDSDSATACVMVGGEAYNCRLDRVRPFEALRKTAIRTAAARAGRLLLRDDGLKRDALAFLSDLKSLLDRDGPESRGRGRYTLLYGDHYHEVHYSHGHSTLVRGPVPSRTGAGLLFLGLRLAGVTRRQLLSVPPHATSSAEAFWTPAGQPSVGALCVGSWHQYRHLLSAEITDVEAVVEWLDAGVILATGRSRLHRLWRDGAHIDTAHVPRVVRLRGCLAAE